MQGANGIETDVHRTKDGALVLFHDETVDRVSNGSGKLSDLTLCELKKLKIFGNAKNGFYDRIPTLNEFLEKFHQYDISFAIELKGAGVEEETLLLVKKYGMLEKTTFTSFNYGYIKKIRQLDQSARIGWLTAKTDDAALERLIDINGNEIDPKAETITQSTVEKFRKHGLTVRAWGVYDTDLMKKMCRLQVDGMTVNFPDKLFDYLGGRY